MKVLSMKNSKSQLLIIFLWMITGHVWGQSDYIKPKCIVDATGLPCTEGMEGQSGSFDIIWQKDGSVIVQGSSVTFTSGMVAPPNSVRSNDQIEASKMILVDETIYSIDEESLGQDFGMIVNRVVDASDPNVKVEVFRRPAITDDNPASISNDFGFDIEGTDYLVYGTELTNAEASSETYYNWPITTYRNGWIPFHRDNIESNDYTLLWNRPEDKGWWWTVYDIGLVILFVVGALTGISEMIGIIYSATTAWGLLYTISILGVGSVMAIGIGAYKAHQYEYFSGKPGSPAQLVPQTKYTTNMELVIPDKVNSTGDIEKERLNEVIDAMNRESHDCSFDPSTKCFYAPLNAVVVKMNVRNAHLRFVKIPGSVFERLTPYQLFKGYYYEADGRGQILTDKELLYQSASDIFSNTENLPKKIAVAATQQTVNLQFSQFEGLPYFYLVHTNDIFNNPAHTIDLGKYGDLSNKEYHLYRYEVISPASGDPTKEIQLGPDGPFLAGDNIMLDNTTFDNVIVNNALYQTVFKPNLTSNPTGFAKLTVNGKTLISSGFNKKIENVVDFGLYVGNGANDGAWHQSKGIVSDDLAVLQSAQWLLADYVFEKEYTPISLDSLKSYTLSHKHLPYVIGQSKLDKDGNYGVPQMMIGQLRHLEELYLHAFDQEDQLGQQKSRLEVLRERLEKIQNTIEGKK